MSVVALIPVSSQDQFADRSGLPCPATPELAVLLAMAALLLLLALGAMIAAARLLLEPMFALIGTLFRLLLILGAAVADHRPARLGVGARLPGRDAERAAAGRLLR